MESVPDRAGTLKDAPPASSTSPGAGPRPRAKAGAYPESVQRLIDEMAKLPGIGRRSAERLAFHVLKASKAEAMELSRAIADVKQKVRHCRVCFNLSDAPATDGDLCSICASPDRDRSVVMVIEQPKDLISLEQTGMYKGIYHVLMGRISPLENVRAGDLTISDLLARLDDPAKNAGGVPVREVVLALNPTLEGDGTALYLAEELGKMGGKDGGVKVTRLARGLPTGTSLEFASKAVLADAIEGRRPM